MAIYYYNQKQTRDLQKAINNAPEKSEVWFQPTHHGGCCQVLRFTNKEKTKTDYCVDTFRSRNSGYRNFCSKLALQNNCLELDSSWIDMILKAKILRFHANVIKGKVEIRIVTVIKKLKGW